MGARRLDAILPLDFFKIGAPLAQMSDPAGNGVGTFLEEVLVFILLAYLFLVFE